MARKESSSNMESQGYKLVSNKTITKSTNSWMDKDGLHFKEAVHTGNPDFVKKNLATTNNGEKSELEFAHNTKVWEKETIAPGTSGTIKEREVVVQQGHNVGDGGETTPDTSDNGETYRSSEQIPTSTASEPSGLQVVKNMVDKAYDNIRWIWTVLVIIGLALGIVGAVAFLK